MKPYISPSIKLPETTIKAIFLGVILSAVLAAANAYLGLYIGMTVSASIPAAVISMALFRLFKRSNILENNAVQTAASAGESLAAGVIFTIPALIFMGYWVRFDYVETTLIALCGGILGVMFTIPLRSALIVKEKLQFPEGVATSQVLKSGEKGEGIKYLAIGGGIGALFKLATGGLHVVQHSFEAVGKLGKSGLMYFGIDIAPALIAVGYIVGLNIAVLVFMGGVIAYYIAVPIYLAYYGVPEGVANDVLAGATWGQVRFLGVGAMIVGGLWAIVSIRKSIASALTSSFKTVKATGENVVKTLRTDYDTPFAYVIWGIGVLIVPIFIIYNSVIGDIPIAGLMTIIMVIAGFLFSAVAGYMAGLVGSSNNPISGVTIATVLTSSLILLALMGTGADAGPAAAIFIGGVVCCAAAIAGDNMQDLKAGNILGATPFRQQIMQVVGVVAAAVVLAPVLNVLHEAYVLGEGLNAPQAVLMGTIANGIFGVGEEPLPWNIIYLGMALGVLIIIADEIQRSRGSGFRIPVLAVAVGLYLPLSLDSGIFFGGVLAWLITLGIKRKKREMNLEKKEKKQAKFRSKQAGLLMASGLITGEALMGIFLAIPFAAMGSKTILSVGYTLPAIAGLLLLIGLIAWLYRIGVSNYTPDE